MMSRDANFVLVSHVESSSLLPGHVWVERERERKGEERKQGEREDKLVRQRGSTVGRLASATPTNFRKGGVEREGGGGWGC